MASHRPYRPALGLDAALKEVSDHKGSLYDPEVVEICTRLFREKLFDFEP
jgi:response regulator RpfG family c-di-GMP phosphodiesterase